MSRLVEKHASVGLTHLRALAIVLVFLCHYEHAPHPKWIEAVGAFGWTGVDLFFVLSGFLISRQLFRSIAETGTFSLPEFYFKRALRIWPAFLVVLACYYCFPSTHEREALPPLWRFLSFTQNIGLDVSTAGTFSHAWSLCIEEQFYFLLPLVLWASMALRLGRRGFWLLALMFVSGFIVRLFVYRGHLSALRDHPRFDLAWYKWIYYPTWARLDGLVVGIALAAGFELRPVVRASLARHGHRMLILGIGLWLAASWIFVEPRSLADSVVAFPAIALVYGVLVCAALSPSSVLARYPSRVTRWLASLSYALYLTHKSCIHLTQRYLGTQGIALNGNAMFVCCVAVCLAVAFGLHFSVERPFMQWRDRVVTRQRSIQCELVSAAARHQ